MVVASVNGLPYVEECLEALAANCPEAEVIVADWTDEATRSRIRDRWPATRLLSFDEPTAVPELRAAGIAAARAPYVAVIEDHCVVVNGWSRALVDAHRAGHSVVGGPIRNTAPRLRDWAAFLCEYSEHMEPMPTGPVRTLPGMNIGYDRAALAEIGDLLAEGRWESWLHPRLAEKGFGFRSEEKALVEHIKDFDIRHFASQCFHYARSHAGMRNEELGRRRFLYALGSPALVPLLYSRIARNVVRKRRHRGKLLLTTPLILAYLSVWALGEAVGYTLGGGRSLLKVR
ncbi:MAG: hypothetical protein QOE13_2576 [Gaiellaceae bacterium]|nr:hypothetical protein [Gaiellaceae bacterium]